MLNNFRDLPTKQKIGAVCFGLVGIILAIGLISSIFSNGQDPAPEPTETSTSSQNATDEPAEESSTTPTEDTGIDTSELPSVDGERIPEVSFGEREISVEEARKAADVAREGVTAFLIWDKNSTLPDRQKKIDKYFTEYSITKSMAPNLDSKAETYIDDETGVNTIASHAEVGSLTHVGGNEKTYRVTVGVTFRQQLQYEGLDEALNVDTTSPLLTVDLQKIDGKWLIREITRG